MSTTLLPSVHLLCCEGKTDLETSDPPKPATKKGLETASKRIAAIT